MTALLGNALSRTATPVDTASAVSTRAAPLLFMLPFAITFLDSAFAYFARRRGIGLTPNAFIVPLVLAYFLWSEPRALRMPLQSVAWLGLLVASFCLAIVTAEGIGLFRVLETGSCVASLYAGFLLWRRSSDADQLGRWMIGLSLLYVVICLIALSGVLVQYFPVTTHYWSQGGVAQARPMLTADSNMQCYYLFPAALVLALPFRVVRTSLAMIAALGGVYVLSQLQTRSGTMVYGGILLLVLLAPLCNPSLGRAKTLIYPAAGVFAVAAFWPLIHRTMELLLYRFTEPDMASGNGRLESTLYGLHHLLDLYWWIPRGADAFLRQYGALPHSNLTAVYLDGGMLGLIAWTALVIVPLVKMTAMVVKGRADGAATMAWIAAFAVLFLQLSLHNPFRDQVWLWAGALIGALARLESSDTVPTTQPMTMAPRSPVRVDANGIINARMYQ